MNKIIYQKNFVLLYLNCSWKNFTYIYMDLYFKTNVYITLYMHTQKRILSGSSRYLWRTSKPVCAKKGNGCRLLFLTIVWNSSKIGINSNPTRLSCTRTSQTLTRACFYFLASSSSAWTRKERRSRLDKDRSTLGGQAGCGSGADSGTSTAAGGTANGHAVTQRPRRPRSAVSAGRTPPCSPRASPFS